jgi:hypothetical protein
MDGRGSWSVVSGGKRDVAVAMKSRTVAKKKRKPLAGVRLPLPRQRGGVHVPKTVYRRKPRTPRVAEE